LKHARLRVRGDIASVEGIRNGVGIEPFALLVGPDSQIVRGAVEPAAGFGVVVAKYEKEGGAGGDVAEVEALSQILCRGGFVCAVFVGHEGVSQIDVEVRLVRGCVGKAAQVEGWLGAVVQVRVRLKGEGKGAAGFALGVEG
jgi:hypothetical protein